MLARRWNRAERTVAFYMGSLTSVGCALAGGAAILAGPWFHKMDPTAHVYPAIVWLLALWVALHVITGVIMQLYCVARRIAGRMTARHDIDIHNTALYWHFAVVTAVITVAVIAGFPLLK